MRLGVACLGMVVLATWLHIAQPPLSWSADGGTDAQLAEGKKTYDKYCAQCHGDTGNGQGFATPYFKPQPRDFTKGKYKVRHTLNGELPLDDDIRSAIINGLAFKRGMAYTGMPPWPNFSPEQVTNLVYYLKSFSPYFTDKDYNNPKAAELPSPPSITEESIKKGRTVFEKNECIKCHGEYGRGDGRSAPTLKDDWENHIRPADLTKRWTFRGGSTREDIFRTITTGFNGTPMPAYVDSVSVEDRWDLVNYVYSLSPRESADYFKPDRPIVVHYTSKSLEGADIESLKQAFGDTTPAYIPIVGQVVQPGREFFPGANEVEVRGVYNNTDLALMVTWHDLQKDVSGSNAPDTAVSEEKPKPKTTAASDDPFADEVAEKPAKDPFAEDEGDPFAEEEVTGSSSKYSDALAIQFPAVVPESFKKPYFLFGDGENPVELWFTDLAKTEAQTYVGKGIESFTAHGKVKVSSVASYDHGAWTVVFRRKLATEGGADGGVVFPEGKFVPISLSVWDGFNEERGAKRGITTWYSLYLDPKVKESPYPLMAMWGLGVLLLEVVVVLGIRRKS